MGTYIGLAYLNNSLALPTCIYACCCQVAFKLCQITLGFLVCTAEYVNKDAKVKFYCFWFLHTAAAINITSLFLWFLSMTFIDNPEFAKTILNGRFCISR